MKRGIAIYGKELAYIGMSIYEFGNRTPSWWRRKTLVVDIFNEKKEGISLINTQRSGGKRRLNLETGQFLFFQSSLESILRMDLE
jgi:hypothetical protein